MRKKIFGKIALLTAAFVLTTSLCGCGPKAPTEEGDTTAESYPGAEVVLNGDAIYPIQCDDALTYWMGQSGSWTHKYENFAETPIGKKIAENTGVNVTYIHPDGSSGEEQFQLLLAADELPDIAAYPWNNYPGGPDMAINEQYIYKLNDLFDKFAPALTGVLAERPDWDKQTKSDSGAYYAFPFILESRLLQVAYGPALRADWLRELNLEAPQTIDEWETVLTAFKNEKNVESPFIGTYDSLIQCFAPAFGVYTNWYKNGDQVVFGPAEPGFKDWVIKMNDWYNKGLIDHDISTVDSKAIDAAILNGTAGSTQAWAGSGLGQWLKVNSDRNTFDLVGTQFPAKVKGEDAEYSYLATPVYMTCGASINKNCVNPELAARFLDYGFTEEGHNLFNFGIEGESYNWVDGYPKYTDFIMNNPDGLSVTNAMGLYIRACYNGIMIQDQRYIEQYYPNQQQKDAQKEWAKTKMDEHILPQLYVQSDEMDRDAEIMANVSTYVSEKILKFVTGNEPIEKYDEYLAQLESFGLSEAKAFRQSALERFNAR